MVSGDLLFRAKGAFKCHHNLIVGLAFVGIVGGNAGFLEQLIKLSFTASGNRDAAASKLAKVYEPRFTEY